MHLIYI